MLSSDYPFQTHFWLPRFYVRRFTYELRVNTAWSSFKTILYDTYGFSLYDIVILAFGICNSPNMSKCSLNPLISMYRHVIIENTSSSTTPIRVKQV